MKEEKISIAPIYHNHLCRTLLQTTGYDWPPFYFFSYDSQKEFLDIYNPIKPKNADWSDPKLVTSFQVESRTTLCGQCPHSAEQRGNAASAPYPDPHGGEKHFRSCPLEQDFTTGALFTLEPAPSEMTQCPFCGNKLPYVHRHATHLSTPVYFDVQYRHHPARIKFLKEQATCPFCGKTISSYSSQRLLVNSTYRFTLRLITVLAEHYRDEGLPQSKFIEAYGISRNTLKRYRQAACTQFIAAAEQEAVKIIANDIQSWQKHAHDAVCSVDPSDSYFGLYQEGCSYCNASSVLLNFSSQRLVFLSDRSGKQRLCGMYDNEEYLLTSAAPLRRKDTNHIECLCYFRSAAEYPLIPHPISFYLVLLQAWIPTLMQWSANLKNQTSDWELLCFFERISSFLNEPQQYTLQELKEFLPAIITRLHRLQASRCESYAQSLLELLTCLAQRCDLQQPIAIDYSLQVRQAADTAPLEALAA